MSIEERNWYRVTGGEVLAAIHRRLMDMHDYKEDILIFARLHGGEAMGNFGLMGDFRCAGLRFQSDPPRGWREKNGGDYCVPDKRTTLGKEAKKELEDLALGYPSDVWAAMDCDNYIPSRGRRLLFPTAGRMDGAWFVGVGIPDYPSEEYQHPRNDIPGLEPVPASEVMAAEEREKARKEAA